MIGRGMIVAALLAYALVLGCVMWPANAPARDAADKGNGHSPVDGDATVATISSREGLPIIAAGMQIQRVDWIDKYMKSIDEAADIGCDAVKFVVDARQE